MSMTDLSLFPGFRFCPTDEELISYYLKQKILGMEKSVQVIPEVVFCQHEPWDLPAKSIIQSDHEWFFFAPRGRKYPNGSQTKRATEAGYWKATGKERPVKSGSNLIGAKRTLVFHKGRAPEGERTDWIMHEYSIKGNFQDSFVVCRLRKKPSSSPTTPNCISVSQKGLSPPSVNAYAVGERNQPQVGTSEAGKETECSSEKHRSSSQCSSSEQVDSASDLPEETCSLQPHTHTSEKNHDVDDDCFADILKEDIIQLDIPSTSSAELPLPTVVDKSVSERNYGQSIYTAKMQEFPFQGTAQRRIRLRRFKRSPCDADSLEACDDHHVAAVMRLDVKQSVNGARDTLLVRAVNYRLILWFFPILVLLVLLLLLPRGTDHF
ncbi:PREDICTED: NAC domain-containing protein 89-like isoform X2 [Nelumbo nucifera]|uniref:NAC domain-containing protein 89-like isoform X2 n=1 Tax=Nelumbo nucifera TaxID=4432 RepID=A0A1U7ZE09_NELNU|nr:PREDICTED: NAC domain-containing protein 89-like isoform X2 [Nelumbo nucifera]